MRCARRVVRPPPRPATSRPGARGERGGQGSATPGQFQIPPARQLRGQVGDDPDPVASRTAAADDRAGVREYSCRGRGVVLQFLQERGVPSPPARFPGLHLRDDRPGLRAAGHDLEVQVLHPPPAAPRLGELPVLLVLESATCRRVSRRRSACVSSRTIAGTSASETAPDESGDRADLRGRGGGVVPEPSRCRRGRADEPLVDRRETGRGPRDVAGEVGERAGVTRWHRQRDLRRHADGHCPRARPCDGRSVPSRCEPRVGHRGHGVAEPGEFPDERAAGGSVALEERLDGGLHAARFPGVAQAGADVLGGDGRAPQRVRQPVHLGRGHLDGHAGQCGGRRGPRAGVVHRLCSRAGCHPIGCPQCPQAVSTGGGQRPFCLRCPACGGMRQRRSVDRRSRSCSSAGRWRRSWPSVRSRRPTPSWSSSRCSRSATAPARGREPDRRGRRLHQRRRHPAAAHPRDRPGGRRRPARRRRHTTGLVVGGDRRRRGDRPLHAVRRHRLRLAVPRRRATRAHRRRRGPRPDRNGVPRSATPAIATAPDLGGSGAVVPRRGG